jgi:hypothetical protein
MKTVDNFAIGIYYLSVKDKTIINKGDIKNE